MKIIAEYDSETGMIKDKHGTEWVVASGVEFNETHNEQSNIVLELVKLGMSAEDILKLKHGGVI